MQIAPKNFYHWVTQCMSRLVFLMPLLERKVGDRVVLIVPDKKFVRETMSALSIDPQRVHFRVPERPPIVYAETLYTVDWRGWGGTAASDGTEFLAPRAGLVRVRRMFSQLQLGLPSRKNAARGDAQPVVIYCSRFLAGNTTGWKRKAVNEAQLVAAMEGALRGSGMVLRVFHGFGTPILDAAALFGRARVVIGVHGGSLANIVFCKEGSSVIEIALPELQYRMYLHMAMALGLHYHMLIHLPEGAFHSEVSVDTSAVVIALQEAMRKQAQGGRGPEPELAA
jgi:hypothetical protein